VNAILQRILYKEKIISYQQSSGRPASQGVRNQKRNHFAFNTLPADRIAGLPATGVVTLVVAEIKKALTGLI
jgi:hypothetical protein